MSLPTPNLVVLGSQKCATTSLHTALSLHPDIFMSRPIKEPMYFYPFKHTKKFLSNYYWTKGVQSQQDLLENYMLDGYSGELYFGESTTGYTYDDRARLLDVPSRMKESGNDIRFIYIVRNPYQRIISFYKHLSKNQEWNGLSFVDFQKSRAYEVAVSTSSYGTQIEPYLDCFSLSNFYICNGYLNFLVFHLLSCPMT